LIVDGTVAPQSIKVPANIILKKKKRSKKKMEKLRESENEKKSRVGEVKGLNY
jgi:hypothetical protein